MAETWVACEKAGEPWMMTLPAPMLSSNAAVMQEVRPCRVGAGGQVSQDVCAACPVPVGFAALEAVVRMAGDGWTHKGRDEAFSASRTALAKYRGEKRSEGGG